MSLSCFKELRLDRVDRTQLVLGKQSSDTKEKNMLWATGFSQTPCEPFLGTLNDKQDQQQNKTSFLASSQKSGNSVDFLNLGVDATWYFCNLKKSQSHVSTNIFLD